MTIRRLESIYAVQGIAFGLLMPFLVPLLVDRGLGPAEIGFVLSATGVASLLAYPLWGAIADGWLGRRRTIALTALIAAFGGLLVPFAGSDPVALTVALSVALVGALAWFPLIDALTLGELGEGSSSYGQVRLWSSAGWAGSATVAGAIWMQVGPAPVFSAFMLGALVLAALVLLPARGQVARKAGLAPGAASPRPQLRRWRPLILTPVLLGFMLGLLITAVGEHASWRFISLRILDQGGGVFLVGLAAALPAIVEIPVFASSRRLAARWGLRWLFVFGALGAAALVALVAVAPEPWMITALRTLEGSAFALRYMAMVMIIGVLLPRHLHAMGQSVAWFVYAGIAPIIGDAAGGMIYDIFGASALFFAATAALLVGGLVVYVVLRGPGFARRETHGGAVAEPIPPLAPG